MNMKVLIATGGAAHSAIAVQMGAQLAQAFPMQVVVLTVIKSEKNHEYGQHVLTEAAGMLTPAVRPDLLQTKMRIGHADDEIVQEAADGRYHLIILGEREHHDLMARLFGPTAERVIHHADCPVLIAKKKVHPIQHILLCDSGGPEQTLLQRLRSQLPQLLVAGVTVTVLHVMSQISAGPGINGKQLRADATELIHEHSPEGELLARDIRQLALSGVNAQPKVRHGLVVDEILDEANGGDYDLVVIGAHRYAGWQRLLLDDLAHKIVLRADRSVLIIH